MTNPLLSQDRIGRASAWRFGFLGIQGGSSVILFAALAHILHREAFAATAVAQGVIVIAQAIGDFGLSQAAVSVLPARIAARPRDEADLLAGAATAYAGAALLGLVLTLVAVPLVPAAAAAPVAVSAPAAAACVLVAGADGILRSRGEFRSPVLLMALSEGGAFLAIPVAIATHSALWTCAAAAAGMAAGSIPAASVLARFSRRGRRPRTRQFVLAGIPVGLTQVFIAMGTRADTILAGGLSGLLAAGTFEGSWRVYQLTQYAAGGLASAAAPYLADALGGGRRAQALAILRRLTVQLAAVGVLGAGLLYLARRPLAHLLTGSLGPQVAGAIGPLALVCPLTALATVAFYTLIGRDDQRRFVLVATAVGAVSNVALAAVLAPGHGAAGVATACAIGLAITALMMLLRFATLIGELRSAGAPQAVVSAGDRVA